MQLFKIAAVASAFWAVTLVSANQDTGLTSTETLAFQLPSQEDYAAIVNGVQRELQDALDSSARNLGSDIAKKQDALKKIVGTTKAMQANLEVAHHASKQAGGYRRLDGSSVGITIGGLASATNAFATIAGMTFDRTYLDRAADFITARYQQFEQVSGEEGADLIGDLAATARSLQNTEASINEIAKTARRQAIRLRRVLKEVQPDEPLYDEELQRNTINGALFEAAIQLLIRNLDTFNTRATEAIATFGQLAVDGDRIAARSQFISQRFRTASETGSDVLNRAVEDQRARAYGTCGGICGVTCIASLPTFFLQPIICGSCVGACFGIAAGVIEGEVIPGLQEDFETASLELVEFSRIFDNFTAVASLVANRASSSRNFTLSSRGELEALNSDLRLGSTIRIAHFFLDYTADAVDQIIVAAENVEQRLVSSDRPSASEEPPLPPVKTPTLESLISQQDENEFRAMGNAGGDPEYVVDDRRRGLRGAQRAILSFSAVGSQPTLPTAVVANLAYIKSFQGAPISDKHNEEIDDAILRAALANVDPTTVNKIMKDVSTM